MKHHHEATSPVSFKANVARLPAKGLPVVIEADERQREALAAGHGLEKVERYRVELMVTPWKRNGVKVAGSVTADIVQACVVSLEPIETHMDEEVSALFWPEDSKLGRSGFSTAGEIVLDADGPDSPETFSDDVIDVGALAEEFFGLAIDPYPRKKDVSLPSTEGEAAGEQADGELQRKLRALMRKS
ncbi:MAG: DUF177 domain-containing protein [Pseudaminobacter sp.]